MRLLRNCAYLTRLRTTGDKGKKEQREECGGGQEGTMGHNTYGIRKCTFHRIEQSQWIVQQGALSPRYWRDDPGGGRGRR